MEFYTARALFGVGLVLTIVGGVTSFFDFGAVSLVGLVLTLVGLYFVAEAYSRKDAFYYMLYGVVATFVGVVVLALFVIGALVASGGFAFMFDAVGFLVGFWLLFWAVVVVGAYFEKRAFQALGEASGRREFLDAAKFVWWGALLTVVVVGLVLVLVGYVFAIVGAFKLEKPGSTL
ncbi:MAG: DUF996 domain-containing protein [Pyrobaculum sp.]